jgi:uncharacterized protein YkwD
MCGKVEIFSGIYIHLSISLYLLFRIDKIPFKVASAGENLFMMTADVESEGGIAREAVNGWIHSPGHQKNLVGNFNLCGIGVHKSNDGMIYLTQILAKR